MKSFIKHRLRELLLKEEMILTNYTDFAKEQYYDYIVIAKDEQNNDNHFLALVVKLQPYDMDRLELGYEFIYGFDIYDINSNKVGKTLYTKTESSKFLPLNSKGKIIPYVIEMMKDLVNRIKPNIIYREAMESNIDKDNPRYQKITQILINELGYKLVHEGKNQYGNQSWKFIKEGNNLELNEQTIDEFYLHNMEARLNRYDKFANEYIKINLNKK